MNSPSGIFDLPRRLSLSAQAAAAIRKAIEEHCWRDFLPSERRLCEMLQVSRPTIRTALRLLAQEGLIEIRQGRRDRLLSRPRSARPAKSRLVMLVTHQPISRTSFTAYQGISEMRAHLAEHGFTTEVFVCPPGSAAAQRRRLETMLRQTRVFCCVLLSVSRELQEFFAARALPALVLGSCHPSVQLPSLDVDYRAVCRHAAGVLRGQGHRRIAFIVPNAGVAGDLASEAGFREGAEGRPDSDPSATTVVRHDGTNRNLAAKLDALFASDRPPTALLVAKPQHTFFVVVYLLRRGLQVPDDVSLIARDHDFLFENALSHYRFKAETFAHRLTRLMFQLVGQGHLPAEASLIFPRFVPCGTVKALA
jgi:LacI family transcriptional regulator